MAGAEKPAPAFWGVVFSRNPAKSDPWFLGSEIILYK